MPLKDSLKRAFLARYLVRKLRAWKHRAKPRDAVFSEIHQQNAWGSRESLSGPGSELAQTAAIRAALPPLLQKLGVKTLLDASCGDFHWMKDVDLGTIHYIGIDIVPALIAENTRRYACPTRQFLRADIVTDSLPPADLVFCRDCLMHLSFTEISAALANLCRTGATHLLITSFRGNTKNADIGHGGWWPMNLQLPPFNLPPPLEWIAEDGIDAESAAQQKSMGLWPREAILSANKRQ